MRHTWVAEKLIAAQRLRSGLMILVLMYAHRLYNFALSYARCCMGYIICSITSLRTSNLMSDMGNIKKYPDGPDRTLFLAAKMSHSQSNFFHCLPYKTVRYVKKCYDSVLYFPQTKRNIKIYNFFWQSFYPTLHVCLMVVMPWIRNTWFHIVIKYYWIIGSISWSRCSPRV